MEDVYHDVIEQNKQQREKLVTECDDIEKLLHTGKVRLERLEKVIADQSVVLHMKQLSVLDVQEKERERIARDLHDSSLQNLTHLVHKVELSSLYIDQDVVKAKLELATVEQGQGEVLEISVLPEFNGKKIMDLRFPARAIIGVIQRRNKVIIPKGDTLITTGDILIIFTTAQSAQQIKEFFKVN